MSFYPPEQRCPRCRAALPQQAPACPNCGLALAAEGAGGAPRASRSGPPPSWQPNDAEGYDVSFPGERSVAPRNSGPAMNRPGELFASRGSDPWGGDAPTSFRQPGSGYQQRPGTFGGSSGPGGRFIDSEDASTSYQGPLPGQPRPSAGWGSSTGGQRPFSSYRNTDPGGESPAGYQRSPADYGSSPSGWGSRPSGFQRPPATSGSTYDDYLDWARGGPETSASAYPEEAALYGRQQTFRGAPGQLWQQQYPGAPTAYPGSQQAYDDTFGAYDPALESGMQPPPRRGKKTALIALVVLLLLGAVGSGAAYLFLRSRPVISVTSKYMVGATPAGTASTTLHLTGAQFASRSAVSFLLDGQPEPGHEIFQSDANGALSGDLTITADWPMGQHSLTAKDASGNTTLQGKTVVIVAQGAANTPGPKGAPADDTPSFTIHATVHQHDKDTGQKSTYPYTLVVTGQPDPAGGKVCSPEIDTGKPQTVKGSSNGLRYTATFTVTCSGTYKGGQLTYTQTFTSYKVVYSNGVTCKTTAPVVNQELDGSFTSATSISGTLSSGTAPITCSNGGSVTLQGVDGTWAGSLSV